MLLSVTGHRPDKLIYGDKRAGFRNFVHSKLLRLATSQLNILWPTSVLTGMAMGWDQAVAEACLDLGIPFQAVLPFSGQEDIWPMSARRHYHTLLNAAQRVTIVCVPGYAGWKMLKRNEYLVEHGDALLALFNGSAGGTKHCVGLANSKGLEVINCWSEWEQLMPQVKPEPKTAEYHTGADYVPAKQDIIPFSGP